MVSVEKHYESLLSDVYTWLMGGFDQAKSNNVSFFEERNIVPTGSKMAIDLGAGSGFQTIPLAEVGFHVTAIDLSKKLLNELGARANNLTIKTIQDDILNFQEHIEGSVELIVCMTDTITHLQSKQDVHDIFCQSFDSLELGGKLVLTFRDLSKELLDTERFIPVRSDENTIFTCFLEFEEETVKIHDIVYIKAENQWNLHKSCYRKVRLSGSWVTDQLSQVGFCIEEFSCKNGFTTIVAIK